MRKFFVTILASLICSGSASANPPGPVDIQCGGTFQPRAVAVEGKAGGQIAQLFATPNVLEIVHIPTALSGGYNSYNQFCNPGDQVLKTQCEAKHQKAAIDDAIAKCKQSALKKGNDDTQYRCQRETCPPGSEGCVKHATNSNCTVAVAKLQCKCDVNKQFDQPTLSQSTVSCGCNCTCTANGDADMQCTNCDGSCVKVEDPVQQH